MVYNEMKGAMASADAQMSQAIDRILLNETPYAWNSGGDPQAIPTLSYDDLVRFHQERYSPDNCLVTTYGDIHVADIHQLLDGYWHNKEPSAFSSPSESSGFISAPPPLQSSVDEEREANIPLPIGPGQEPQEVAQAGYHWVLGDCRDPDMALRWHLVDQLLLGSPAAPLRFALENSGLGRSIGSSGFDNSAGVGQFTIELDGCLPDNASRLKQLILDTLEQICSTGFTDDQIDAAMHQLEIAQRRIGWRWFTSWAQFMPACNHGVEPWC